MHFIGKYIYAHPEHKQTCTLESTIQSTIAEVASRHGDVIGDTSALRHFTLAFGCTGDHKAIAKAVKKAVPELLKKHNKAAFDLHVQQFMFCPGPAPVVAVTPKTNSADWKFFTELQATLLLDPTVNAAHPDYEGPDKITDEKKFPAGFLDLKKAIDGGATMEDAAHRWMWPHMSAFQLVDKEAIGGFVDLKREALVEKYGWILATPVDVVVPIRVIGVSLETADKEKFRYEITI